MPEHDDVARTLSREDLYELVWSKPMVELAKDFGISDVALAKRCRCLAIPVPGRGYWARLDAGQRPYRPKLSKREPELSDRHALTIRPQGTDAHVVEGESATASESPDSLRERIAGLSIPLAGSIMECAPAVKRTARHFKHVRRSEFVFDRGERTGPIVSMNVSDGVLDRACLLADRVLRSCESLGWSFVGPPRAEPDPDQENSRSTSPDSRMSGQTPIGQITVAGERVGFHIEERLRDEAREPTPAELAREKREYGYRAARKVQIPTGKLRVVRLDTYCKYGSMSRLTWYDRGSTPVEGQIVDILTGLSPPK